MVGCSSVILLEFGEIIVQLIEAALPHLPLLNQPLLGELQPPRYEPIGPHPADLLRANEAAPFQHLEVLEEGGQRHVERLRQLGHGRGTTAQALEDLPPRGIGQCPEHAIDGWRGVGHDGELSLVETLRSMAKC